MTFNKRPLFAGKDRSYGRRTLCVAAAARFASLVSDYRPAARSVFRSLLVCLGTAFRLLHASDAQATSTSYSLASGTFSQNWSNSSQITSSSTNWSGVSSIEGYFGAESGSAVYSDVGAELGFGTSSTPSVFADDANPNTDLNGGIAEFSTLANPVVALQGSGSADHPFLLLYLNSTGRSNVTISFNARDVDGSSDDATQQIALQYRLSTSGAFTNVPRTGFLSGPIILDATTPNSATLITPVSATIAAWANQLTLQIRIMTGHANTVSGTDEWVGIDDILVTSVPEPSAVFMFLIGAFGILRYAGRNRRMISSGELT